jgi:N-acetylneuraminate synthase
VKNADSIPCSAFRSKGVAGPFVIAELGVNHEGSLERAKQMIEEAAAAGADCVKFQTYKAELLAAHESPAYWDLTLEPTRSQLELFKKYDCFNGPDYVALAEHARLCNVAFASTPFDLAAVEMLAPLVPFYKIASADITNEQLLLACASQGKPVVLSTGASYLSEIDAAVRLLRRFLPASEIAILHCVLSYPTAVADANLRAIEHLVEVFPGHPIGYSDHTQPDDAMLVLTRAAMLGASIIEKHFTYNKSLPGNDHYHAMDAQDLKRFRSGLALLQDADGSAIKTVYPPEEISRRNARRSLVAVRSLPLGHVLTRDDLMAKRPANGLPPADLDWVVGKRLTRELDADGFLTIEHLTSEG